MSPEQIDHFRTFGFLHCKQLLAAGEIEALCSAFDRGMARARQGAPAPKAGEKRQQVVPFFDYHPEAFYPLLDDPRIIETFAQLMGEDFILTLSEGILHTSGTGWHHDACAPDGLFSMRAAIYLDALGPDEGCLSVIPGSHFEEFRQAITAHKEAMEERPGDVPGRHPLINEPGDVVFMNHKTYHAAIGDRPGRRALHINAVQNANPQKNQVHYDWLVGFLQGETEGWGRFYSDRLVRTAGPRRRHMLERAMALGFGDTGPVRQLQDLQ